MESMLEEKVRDKILVYVKMKNPIESDFEMKSRNEWKMLFGKV